MDTPKRKKRTEREGFSFTFDPDACKQCRGNCCIGESGNIFLNQKEIRAISEFLNMELSRFISDYLRKVSYKFSIREIKIKGSYLCVFFDETNRRCSIYPVRPNQCRTFPFWNYFKENPEALFKECPGVYPKDTPE